MREVYALVSVDNITYNIDCTIFLSYKEAYQQMVKEFEGIKETLCAEKIEHSDILKDEAQLHDGDTLYYWQIKKRKIVVNEEED